MSKSSRNLLAWNARSTCALLALLLLTVSSFAVLAEDGIGVSGDFRDAAELPIFDTEEYDQLGKLEADLFLDEACVADLVQSDPLLAAAEEEYLALLQDPEKLKTLILYRKTCTDKCIIGELWMDGERLCYTLELPDRNNKRNESCIPEGTYQCDPFSGNKYKNVWQVMNVPNRSSILIHTGNYPSNTRGCVLVGLGEGENAVWQSKKALELLRKKLNKCSFKLEIKKEAPPSSDSTPTP
ncbi:MAG: hypothetical protein KDD70_08960 [Bdellovibrionales bacterium]|nr:hypothetical protein [Bdellovibrionales bacterium]